MKKIRTIFQTRVAKNSFWLIAAKIYQVAVNLAVSVLTARFLGPSNFGLINYAASFTAMFTALCTLGINSILVNELLADQDRQGELLGSAIILRLLSSLFSAVTIVALAWMLNPEEKTTVAVVAIYSTTLLCQCFDTLNCWYHARMQARTVAVISAVGYTAASAYKIFLLVTRKSVQWFAASHAVEYSLVALLLMISYYRCGGRKLRFSFPGAKMLLGRSYHYILSGLMVAVYTQMDKIMLKSMLGEASVGFYSAAAAICGMWPFILAAIIDAARPMILTQHRLDRRKFESSLTVLYGAILGVSFAVAGCITLMPRWIIRLLYGNAYLEAAGTLCILCWSTAFSYLGVARSIWLVPEGKQKYEKYIALSGALCNLILNSLLIPAWGVRGAAAATLMTQILSNLVVGFFLREIRPNNLLILRGFCFWRYLKDLV